MSQPSLEFLSLSIAQYLLHHYNIQQPPVPVREFLIAPLPGLVHDLSLTEVHLFGDAYWVRLLSGQGVVFANQDPALSEARRRYAMASAIFRGICSSSGGYVAGLAQRKTTELRTAAQQFARELLMPPQLLPANWNSLAMEALAEMFCVPLNVVESRRQELSGR